MSQAAKLGLVVVLAAGPLFAAADKQVLFDERSHVITDQTLPCIGTLHLDFWVRQRVTQLSDGSGGFHFSNHFNVYNFRATDEFGTEYSGSQAANYTFHVAAGGAYPLEETYIETLTGSSHGSGPNLLIKTRYRVTINAPGQATVQRDIFSIECTPD